MDERKLTYDFYKRNAIEVAKDLLGKYLIRKIGTKDIICKIVETEAYIGPEDKACHAYDNKKTKRTKSMFKSGGNLYIYQIYGIHYCLNIVTNLKEKPEAVLIRAIEPIEGLDIIKRNRKIKSEKIENLTNGPGKLTKALLINKKFDGYNIINGDEIYIIKPINEKEKEIVQRKRINIDYAVEYKDKLWRFYIKGNKFISKY